MATSEDALAYVAAASKIAPTVVGLPENVEPRKINSVGIIGAGLMGGGIGMACANVGIDVVILDMNEEALARGMKLVESNYGRSRSMSPEKKVAALARFKPTVDYADLAQVDMVVEAVFESMEIKEKIFSKLDKVCKPNAFLCSNTSQLNIDQIAMATSPARRPLVMGTHFFSPANVMKLLENVRGASTSDETIATMMAWGQRIGKIAILVGNCHGFVGNRMVNFYGGAARAALAEGALPIQVDTAAMKFGFGIGPLMMSDMVGLDLGMQGYKAAGAWSPETIVDHALVEEGRCGQKTKAGYYDYEEGSRKPIPSAHVEGLLRQRYPIRDSSATPSEEEILSSLLIPMVNEAFKILEEGIAQRPSDVDVCYVYGYNFPAKEGGPLYWADRFGLEKVLSWIQNNGQVASSLLVRCVESNMSLAQYWEAHGGPGAPLLRAKL